ncbi:MAG: TfoX/Sxy family protein [Alphaproteobacteria bacterium]|nr:TfoX/Sxy family protein [Alphaproteobacteria bacterium]
MPYDPDLAERIRTHLAGTPGLVEKKMFGGIGWTVGGHMAAGAHSDGALMIRCAKEDFAAFIAEPGAAGMKRGETLMTGWVLIASASVATDAALHHWLDRGRGYAASLPPK